MGGKRTTIRSRSISWREGLPKRRRRAQGGLRRAKRRPILGAALTMVTGLVATGLALRLAWGLSRGLHVPLHLGYGLILPVLGGGCWLLSRRDRGTLSLMAWIAALWIGGEALLSNSRNGVS